jgi:hypothetical protein
LTSFRDPNTFLSDSAQLYRSSEPQDLALKLSNLSEATKILVRNASGISFPNQAQPLEVEILDAAVFVDAKDWPQVKARMAAREQRCPALATFFFSSKATRPGCSAIARSRYSNVPPVLPL